MVKRLTPRSSSQVAGFVVEMNVKVYFQSVKLREKLIFQDLTGTLRLFPSSRTPIRDPDGRDPGLRMQTGKSGPRAP